jgi:hypothetical protein
MIFTTNAAKAITTSAIAITVSIFSIFLTSVLQLDCDQGSQPQCEHNKNIGEGKKYSGD